MAAFVTLTLNPAIDRSGKVSAMVPGEKLRCHDERTDPGGGGINVARMLARLGGEVVAVFAAGGAMGDRLTRLVEAEQIVFRAVRVKGETRENFSVRDMASANQYRFVFPGPQVEAAEIERCCAEALALATPGGFLILSGSLPAGADAGTYAAVIRKAQARGIRVVLDCSGAPLLAALGSGVEILKLSEAELAGITGATVQDRSRCLAAARLLLGSGLKMVAITRGAKGALLVTAEEAWMAAAPPVRALSTVGAGDSFLAALVFSLHDGASGAAALQQAVAAGSAALLTEGTGLARPQDMKRLTNMVSIWPAEHQLPEMAES